MNEFLELEEQVLRMIKTVYDPEIPVNIYELGLIYRIDLPGDGVCNIDMTLTAPNCPAADFLVEDVKQKVGSVDGINEVNVNIVFEPEWNKDMMSGSKAIYQLQQSDLPTTAKRSKHDILPLRRAFGFESHNQS